MMIGREKKGSASVCDMTEISIVEKRIHMNISSSKLPYLRFELQFTLAKSNNRQARRVSSVDNGEATYFGPRLRRLLGPQLAQLSCPCPPPICRRGSVKGPNAALAPSLCLLADTCAFGVLFAKSRAGKIAGGVNALSPFSLHVPAVSQLDGFTYVEMTLYASAWPFYLPMVAACARIFSSGIGRERERYRLRAVHQVKANGDHEMLCDDDLAHILRTVEPDYLDTVLLSQNNDNGPVSVALQSPTRLLVDSKLQKGDTPLSFPVLIESILSKLRDHYGQEAESLLPGGSAAALREQAKGVVINGSDLRWMDIPDNDRNTRSSRLLGGKIGQLTFNEVAGRFLPLLKVGEILHIGKNAASGCGRIAVIEA